MHSPTKMFAQNAALTRLIYKVLLVWVILNCLWPLQLTFSGLLTVTHSKPVLVILIPCSYSYIKNFLNAYHYTLRLAKT